MITLKYIARDWFVPPAIWKLAGKFRTCKLMPQHSAEERALLRKTASLKDRHAGQRCFILGAGPSVTDQDLKKLQGEYVISVSNTFVHGDYPLFKPTYHVLPHLLRGHGRIYSEDKFVQWLKQMERQTFDAEMLLHIGDRALIEKHGLFRNREIHWNEYVEWDQSRVMPLDLSRVPAIWSVSELAITAAIYMGFEKIYLLGMDHDWFNGLFNYFYNPETEHAVGLSTENLEHVDSEFQMRRHADIFRKYKYLYQIKKNIYNANANQNSYVDVFPKVEFSSLFG